jgi:cytochrome o ubiquinol oxidase subunit II
MNFRLFYKINLPFVKKFMLMSNKAKNEGVFGKMGKMKGKKNVLYMLLFSGIILFLFLMMQLVEIFHFQEHIAILFPKGIIALEERNLLFIIQALMLIVIIPVYVLTFIFSWKYRANNPEATYDPDLVDNKLAEYIWWGIPLIMTLIIAALTWVKTHELDPYKPIVSANKPMTIQVVALQWKWLFIYPEEKIASLNFMQIPVHTPIHFEITADAPMNSFWIPHLGGQIYAMPKMKTELNLIADQAGDFRGSSANLSGEGFAGMHFITRASSEEDFVHWKESAKQSEKALDFTLYETIAAPSQDAPAELYQLKDENLFNQIMMKYMHPKEKE